MKPLLRWLALVLLAAVALELFFVLRIALMAVVDPQSTSFQRSEIWAQLHSRGSLRWQQQWVPYAQISDHLKRAVIASEDDGFVNHEGVDWNAVEKAWERNARAEALAQARAAKAGKAAPAASPAQPQRVPKIRGGSTITQQLAKNLLLSGERTLLRKGQEFILTMALELFLSKQRILEIYLNNVEWGEGVFGAEAAAQHYYRKSAARLAPAEAARLAVMLPAPKRFEKTPGSAYLAGRTRTILARMGSAQLP
ncbi:transglycosylase domain-containing protein [Extensimonas vulgaris]|uniref:Biosynthetic peptidoglycan transglycosylase n=1 Tax=Extensimonas vulgaris TaxID=1031594 RepID=A0A369ARG2_9BURK|nr:transglycosylase domain-containing protein [Extensimonas vulgaris]RCX10817.1 monofunctional biosynthetic peptidoglycan transglycosylase [Extensimonas vulgaris]TWI41489.1 monofunctional biosynthetic peptidoglycan transglycosylase [Extensimonas vulgaris]TXD16919.1 monofunctional biosynthetic peptidoglycan transglycosylase [Extensimonas vulgaris]